MGLALLAFTACEKDEDRIIMNPGDAPTLTSSVNKMVLVQEEAENEAVTFAWTKADYGFQAGVKYSIEADVKGSDFANAKSVTIGNSLEKQFTVSELNALLNKVGVPADTESPVEFRIKAEVAPSVDPVYSNAVTVAVTPYSTEKVYPSLWVPGGYQGWSPATAPKIYSLKEDGTYEGYVYFSEASEFKFTSLPEWSGTNYGNGGAGKLDTDGGAGNLSIPEAGMYLLKVNTNTLTWSATKTNWGVIGSATAGGWDSDQDLIWDATTRTLRKVMDLSVGKIKFRANDDWPINLGDAGADGILEYGADDIDIATAGTYEVVLDLKGPFYTYTLNKQ